MSRVEDWQVTDSVHMLRCGRDSGKLRVHCNKSGSSLIARQQNGSVVKQYVESVSRSKRASGSGFYRIQRTGKTRHRKRHIWTLKTVGKQLNLPFPAFNLRWSLCM